MADERKRRKPKMVTVLLDRPYSSEGGKRLLQPGDTAVMSADEAQKYGVVVD